MAVVSMKQLLRLASTLVTRPVGGTPKCPRIYLHGAQRHLYHRPAEDRKEAGRSLQLCPRSVRRGQTLLFVGTKKQAQEAIKEEATRCGGATM